MENKMTAIEWLLENLNFRPYDEEEFKSNDRICEQAKAMETKQIKNAYRAGQANILNLEDFYKETYGN